jgi:hypothetical protein
MLFFGFYYQIIPASILGGVSSNFELSYQPVCTIDHYCRSLGYPYIQSIFARIMDNGLGFIFFQVWLFFVSSLFLSKQFYFLTGKKILSTVLFFAIVLNPKLFKYTLMLVEEGLYISFLIFTCALLVWFCRKISWKILILLSLTIGLIITIRPAGYALLPLLLIIWLFYYKHMSISPIWSLMVVLIPAMSIVSFESYLYYSNNHHQRESTLGVNLLGIVPQIAINKPVQSDFPILTDRLYDKGKSIRELINQAENFSIAQYLRNEIRPVYHDLGGLSPDIDEAIKIYKTELGTRDAVTTGVFIEYAKANPIEILKYIALNFIGNWQISEILNLENWQKLNQNLNQHVLKETLEVSSVQRHLKVIRNYAPYIAWVKWVFVLIFSLCIYLFITGWSDWKKETNKMSYTAITSFLNIIFPVLIFGYFLLLSIIINVQVRLIFIYWPLMVLVLCLTLLRVFNFKKME